jgi:hypothetical protein
MGIIIHQGAFAQKIVFSEKRQAFFFAIGRSLKEFDFPVKNDIDILSVAVFVEEKTGRFVFSDLQMVGDQFQFRLVEAFEKLDTPDKFEYNRRLHEIPPGAVYMIDEKIRGRLWWGNMFYHRTQFLTEKGIDGHIYNCMRSPIGETAQAVYSRLSRTDP